MGTEWETTTATHGANRAHPGGGRGWNPSERSPCTHSEKGGVTRSKAKGPGIRKAQRKMETQHKGLQFHIQAKVHSDANKSRDAGNKGCHSNLSEPLLQSTRSFIKEQALHPRPGSKGCGPQPGVSSPLHLSSPFLSCCPENPRSVPWLPLLLLSPQLFVCRT